MRIKYKKFFALAAMFVFFLNPTLVIAQTESSTINVSEYKGVQDSLTQFLCTPAEGEADSRALEKCINKMYRFGISFGAIALVFFVVFAGYLYITGGESGKEKAKGIIQNALIGMGLLLGSYVILSFINPNLVIIKPIQPPIFDAAGFPSCEEIGFSATCTLAGGGIAFGGDEDCAMPIAATAVKSYNNTVHNAWDQDEDTPNRHRTVRQPPNAPLKEGAVDLVVGQVAHPVYAPISGKVTYRSKDNALKGSGAYISISSNTTAGSSTCDSANGCANLAHISPSVNEGDMVKAGQQVGKIFLYPDGPGKLGPHLHLELRLAGQWISGDGKAGTWKNMQAAISQCMARKANGGSSTVAVDMSKPEPGMVEVTEASHGVKINMKYATTDNFTGTVLYKQNKCYLTTAMANKLKKAQTALSKKSKTLEMLDCYRPPVVQDLMVAWAKGKVDWAGKQAPQPNDYLTVPYIATKGDHPQGKAVDLTISGASMPTAFDEFSTKAGYDPKNIKNTDAKLLYDTMTSSGFAPYVKEWWHFKDDGKPASGTVAGNFDPIISNRPGTGEGANRELIASLVEAPNADFCPLRDAETTLQEQIFGFLGFKTAHAQRKPCKEVKTKSGQLFTNMLRQQDYNGSYPGCTKPGTIPVGGCGPTSLAMALWTHSYHATIAPAWQEWLTKNDFSPYSPIAIGHLVAATGGRGCFTEGPKKGEPNGSTGDFAAKIMPYYGFSSYMSSNEATIDRELANGNYVLVRMKAKSTFTSGGHFLLLWGVSYNYLGSGQKWYYFADPNANVDVRVAKSNVFYEALNDAQILVFN